MEYNQNVKKIVYSTFLVLILVCTAFVSLCGFNVLDSNAQSLKIRIIYNQAPIYDRVDFLQITNEERQSSLIKVATIDEVYDVIQEIDNIYKIQLEDAEGYILKSMTIDDSVSSPVKYLNYNAEIITESVIYQKISTGYVQTSKKIERGKEVCITGGYNQKNEFTLVSYYENDSIVNGYVKTDVLKVDGVNASIFVYISVIIAGITVAVVLAKLVIGKKKKI